MITLDKDFSNTIVYPPRDYAGVVFLRLPEPFELPNLEKALAVFATAAAGRTLKGKLWVVDIGRVREYADESLDE